LKPGFIAINLLLLAGIGAAVWQARVRWIEARDARLSAVNVKFRAAPGLPPLAPEPKPDAPPATRYVDVATNNLFSKDRNPTVVVEPPKAEKPREMPPLPVVYGVMGLPSGTKALMAETPSAPSRSVHAGDTVGEFKIASLDPRTVVFNWQGKDVTRNIEDLMDRSNHNPAAASGPALPPPNGSAAGAPASGIPPPPPSRPNPAAGVDVGSAARPARTCAPGDTSPAGTVVDGYRKVITATPLVSICRWVPVQ
jgi:hypothetical protein